MPLAHPPDLTVLTEDPNEPFEASDELPQSPATDDGSSSASSASSTSTIRPSVFSRPSQSAASFFNSPHPSTNILPPPRPRRKPLYDPIPWNVHFSYSHHLTTLDSLSTFHVYITPPTSSGPLFITHHGAGSSGLSFALLASEIRKLLPFAGVLSFDCRGHGETSTPDDHDLSLTTLSDDLATVVRLTAAQYGWEPSEKMPDMVLVGHSLGGAVVVDFVKNKWEFGRKVLGYVVIDVVEGSAMDALQSMKTYLEGRPSGFGSLEQGIEWQ